MIFRPAQGRVRIPPSSILPPEFERTKAVTDAEPCAPTGQDDAFMPIAEVRDYKSGQSFVIVEDYDNVT